MKKLFKVIGMLLIVAVGLYGWREWSNHKLRASVEETRQQLQRAGFKTELTDFNLTPPAELQRRAETITNAALALRNNRALGELQLMKPLGGNVALRVTQLQSIPPRGDPSSQAQLAAFLHRQSTGAGQTLPSLPPFSDEQLIPRNLWEQMAAELAVCGRELDSACDAINRGRFRFTPVSRNGDFLLPYLADIKRLCQALSARSALAIHENRMDTAFDSLLALTQLSTHWQPEPVEISHLVRFACAQIAQAPLWEALQADGWTDEQLAALQREWESAEFFAGLPETAALQRASLVEMCRNARAESFIRDYGGWGAATRQIAASIRGSPKNGLRELGWFIAGYRSQLRYQSVGSYEDEKGLLLYYRDREVEIKRAIACRTWLEMRAIPGMTNMVPYQSAQPSRMGSMVNMRQMSLAHTAEGLRPLARAAEVEMRRRLMVTALALKRFQIQHGRIPATLTELTPALLRSVPLDFMDGKELRYQRFGDYRFILYSVGLDGIDNGGQMKTREQLRDERSGMGGYAADWFRQNTDIVWPMPADEDQKLFYELSTDEKVLHLNEVMLREMEKRYLPPQPERSFWPYRGEFE